MLFRSTAESAGLRLQIVDVSPAALCNAFRYNYGDLDGCTMLHTTDDLINFNGRWGYVERVEGRSITLHPDSHMPAQPGSLYKPAVRTVWPAAAVAVPLQALGHGI